MIKVITAGKLSGIAATARDTMPAIFFFLVLASGLSLLKFEIIRRIKTVTMTTITMMISLKRSIVLRETKTEIGTEIFVKCNTENITVTTENAIAVKYIVDNYPEITLITSVVLPDEVSTEAELRASVAAGKNIVLSADIAVDADSTILVAADKNIEIDLNGFSITAER